MSCIASAKHFHMQPYLRPSQTRHSRFCAGIFDVDKAHVVPLSVQMDRMGANFFRTVDMIVTNLAATPLVLTLPIGAEDNFQVRGRRPPGRCPHTHAVLR